MRSRGDASTATIAGDQVTALLATAHLKGPHVDFAGALAADRAARRRDDRAAVGLLGSRWVRAQLVPALSLGALGAALGLTIWQWGAEQVDRLRRAAHRRRSRSTLNLVLIAGGDLHGAARLALAGRARSRARRVPRAAADLGRGHVAARRARRTRSRCSSASSCSSIPLYVLCATEMRREHSLESGLKYLIVGSVGSATLLYGLAMIYGATGATDFAAIAAKLARAASPTDALTLTGIALCVAGLVLQGVGRALPPVDAGRLRGRADAGHGVHGGDDEGRGARRVPALLRRRADRRARELGPGARGARDDHDRRRQRRRARAVLAEADARLLVGRAGRLHARGRRRRHAARRAGDGASTWSSTW